MLLGSSLGSLWIALMVGPRWKEQGDFGTSLPILVPSSGTPGGAARKAPKSISFGVLNTIRAEGLGAPGPGRAPSSQ